jgi:hypothetical protein
MCFAGTQAQLEEELSNTLHHLYRLSELCKRRLDECLGGVTKNELNRRYSELLESTNDLRAARAAMWARSFDTHESVVVASPKDAYSNYYTNMYGVLVWKPLEDLPEQIDKHNLGRHIDYRDLLQGRPVLDTIRRAFDAMASTLISERREPEEGG